MILQVRPVFKNLLTPTGTFLAGLNIRAWLLAGLPMFNFRQDLGFLPSSSRRVWLWYPPNLFIWE